MANPIEFPSDHTSYPGVYALGRMTAAWGEVEHQFFVLLTGLMSVISPFWPPTEKDPHGGRDVDVIAAVALYFSQDSSRARRQMVLDLAAARLERGLICKEMKASIIEVAAAAAAVSSKRNIYSHTKLSFLEDGKIEIHAPDLLLKPGARRHPPSEIDKVTNEIRRVSKRAFALTMLLLATPLEPPPAWA